MKSLILILLLTMSATLSAQDFFKEIPEAPATYTANTVALRMIDGLGFRYYWATEGLTEENLSYRITEESRSLRETLDHLLNLSVMTRAALEGEVFDRATGAAEMEWPALRAATLNHLQEARMLILEGKNLEEAQIDFGNDSTFPFWNAINGPIEDAVWHTGQVVMLRRAAGNPLPKGVNVFLGKKN